MAGGRRFAEFPPGDFFGMSLCELTAMGSRVRSVSAPRIVKVKACFTGLVYPRLSPLSIYFLSQRFPIEVVAKLASLGWRCWGECQGRYLNWNP